MRCTVLTFLTACILFGTSCAPTRFVEPLEGGEQALSLSAGGPLINFAGATIPIPLSSVCYGRGINSNTTVFGGLHTTALVFGNLQTDLGAVFRLREQTGHWPGLSVSPVLNSVIDLNDPVAKAWPQLDLNAYWNHGNFRSYAGMSNWFELSGKRVHDQEQLDRWLLNPHVGLLYESKSFQYNLEVKYMGASHENVYAFVPYSSITNKGAPGIYLGIVKTF